MLRSILESRACYRATLAIAAVTLAAALGGCENGDSKPPLSGSNAGAAITKPTKPNRPAPPTYREVASQFNQRVAGLERLNGWTNISLTYFDERGEQRNEQPEGRLQIIRPNKLALPLGKAGTTLFWFGSDTERYWWLDLTDKAQPLAAVGRHELWSDQSAKRIGLAIAPLDLIRLLGIVPLDPSVRGATQWSETGEQIGVTSPLGGRGLQRMWINPKTMAPEEIEIFDAQRRLAVSATLEGVENVDVTRDGASSARPQIAQRINVTHYDSGSTVIITLSGVKDGPVSQAAFDLNALLKRNDITRVIDVDQRR